MLPSVYLCHTIESESRGTSRSKTTVYGVYRVSIFKGLKSIMLGGCFIQVSEKSRVLGRQVPPIGISTSPECFFIRYFQVSPFGYFLSIVDIRNRTISCHCLSNIFLFGCINFRENTLLWTPSSTNSCNLNNYKEKKPLLLKKRGKKRKKINKNTRKCWHNLKILQDSGYTYKPSFLV